MFEIHLVEWKDHPGDTPPDKYYKIGKMVGFRQGCAS